MASNVYTVVGSTGKIGQVLAEELLKRGHEVRALGRDPGKLALLKTKGAKARAVTLDDAAALADVFRGSAGVFILIPPDYGQDDFGAYQDRAGEAIATALKQAGVSHVLNLSSLGAELSDGTGPIKGLYRHEKRLEALQGLNVLHLRPAYFMENHLFSIPLIKGQGINGSPISAELPFEMVATKDIGVKAAELLDRLAFRGRSVVDVVGPRPVSMLEATAAIGQVIGKPDLKYVQFAYADAEKGMLGIGMKPSLVSLTLEMYRAINDARIVTTQQPVRGMTSIGEFASQVFAEAYRG